MLHLWPLLCGRFAAFLSECSANLFAKKLHNKNGCSNALLFPRRFIGMVASAAWLTCSFFSPRTSSKSTLTPNSHLLRTLCSEATGCESQLDSSLHAHMHRAGCSPHRGTHREPRSRLAAPCGVAPRSLAVGSRSTVILNASEAHRPHVFCHILSYIDLGISGVWENILSSIPSWGSKVFSPCEVCQWPKVQRYFLKNDRLGSSNETNSGRSILEVLLRNEGLNDRNNPGHKLVGKHACPPMSFESTLHWHAAMCTFDR